MKDQIDQLMKETMNEVKKELPGLIVAGVRTLIDLGLKSLEDYISARINATVAHADEAIKSVKAEIIEEEQKALPAPKPEPKKKTKKVETQPLIEEEIVPPPAEKVTKKKAAAFDVEEEEEEDEPVKSAPKVDMEFEAELDAAVEEEEEEEEEAPPPPPPPAPKKKKEKVEPQVSTDELGNQCILKAFISGGTLDEIEEQAETNWENAGLDPKGFQAKWEAWQEKNHFPSYNYKVVKTPDPKGGKAKYKAVKVAAKE